MKMKLYSRLLRKNLTDAEQLLWNHLRCRQVFGFKFRRQVPIGNYIVDFLCYEIRVGIEVDGGQHNGSKYDEIRTRWLNGQGFRVYRFWNHDVLENIEGVVEVVQRICLNNPPSCPSPARGEGTFLSSSSQVSSVQTEGTFLSSSSEDSSVQAEGTFLSSSSEDSSVQAEGTFLNGSSVDFTPQEKGAFITDSAL